MSAFHNLCLFIFLALYGCFHPADSVKCAKDSDCVKTDFTLPKCQDGNCGCEVSYQQIASGCGKKLEKPSLTFDGRPNSIEWAYEETKNVSLKCHAPNMIPGSMTGIRTIWKFGDEELQETSEELKIYISAATVASPYTCAFTPKSASDAALTSEFSQPFQISIVKANTFPEGNWKPVLDVPVKSLANINLPLSCANLPLGIKSMAKIEFFNTSSAVQQKYPFQKNVELYCKVTLNDDKAKSRKSEKVNITIAENINGVKISIVGYPPTTTNLTVKTGQEVTLKCQNDGSVAVGPSSVAFTWKVDQKPVQPPIFVGKEYVVDTSVPGSKTYTCTGRYGLKQIPRESTGITISVEDEPLPNPAIEFSPQKVTPERHVSLTCGKKDPKDEVTYFWEKNGVPIIGQYDRVIQFHGLGMAKDKYRCITIIDGYVVASRNTTISVKPNIPTLSVTNTPKAYSQGVNYTLNCTTSPTSDEVIYHFFKNNTLLNGTSQTHTLEEVDASDSGTYTCEAQLVDTSSNASNSVEIFVGAAGKYCDSKNDCQGEEYSGVCATNRCGCHSGYKVKGDHCESSATHLKVSILALALAGLLSLRIL